MDDTPSDSGLNKLMACSTYTMHPKATFDKSKPVDLFINLEN